MNKLSTLKLMLVALLLVTQLFSMNTVLFAAPSPKVGLEVYTWNEAFSDKNIAKPRFYIKNTGSVELTEFTLYYFITAEEGKTIVLEDYRSPKPESLITLVSNGGGEYAIRMEFAGLKLKPGDTIPNTEGYGVVYHNSDWSELDKRNDFSDTGINSFTLNDKVSVVEIKTADAWHKECNGRTSSDESEKRDYTINYRIVDDWGKGARIEVTITNNTPKPIKGWKLDWNFTGPQQINGLWNGRYKQDKNEVSVTNESYNATIPANGGSIDFGFNIDYFFANESPLEFVLDVQ